MAEKVLNELKEERDKLIDQLLDAEEDQKQELIGKVMDIDDLIESLKYSKSAS